MATDDDTFDGLKMSDESAPAGCGDGDSPASVPQWQSSDLLQGQREALIVHGGEVYRLRCTRNGKLILQK